MERDTALSGTHTLRCSGQVQCNNVDCWWITVVVVVEMECVDLTNKQFAYFSTYPREIDREKGVGVKVVCVCGAKGS